MKRRGVLSRFRDSEHGLAVVEFAVLVPVLVLIIMGIAEIGRFAYFSVLVGNAARAGAQYGAQNLHTATDTSGMETAALNDGQNGLSISGLTADSPAPTHFCQCVDSSGTATDLASCIPTDCTAGTHRVVFAQVTVNGSFTSLFRYPGLPSSFTVSRTAIMPVGDNQ